jgi:hypothetical protein
MLACGGESGGAGSCGAFDACGGDATGSWVSESVCDDGSLSTAVEESTRELPPACASGFTVSPRLETIVNVDATGAFSQDGTLFLDWQFRFDLPCISALAGQAVPAAAIPSFCQAIQEELGSAADTPFQNFACEASSAACDCDADQAVPVEERGTVDPQSGSAALGDGSTAEFCVNGDELTLRDGSDPRARIVTTYTRQR